MKEDEQGWGGIRGAPAAKFWHCPECHHNSAVEAWTGPKVGERKCPNCEHVFQVKDAARISEADAEGPVQWENGSGVRWDFKHWMEHLKGRTV